MSWENVIEPVHNDRESAFEIRHQKIISQTQSYWNPSEYKRLIMSDGLSSKARSHHIKREMLLVNCIIGRLPTPSPHWWAVSRFSTDPPPTIRTPRRQSEDSFCALRSYLVLPSSFAVFVSEMSFLFFKCLLKRIIFLRRGFFMRSSRGLCVVTSACCQWPPSLVASQLLIYCIQNSSILVTLTMYPTKYRRLSHTTWPLTLCTSNEAWHITYDGLQCKTLLQNPRTVSFCTN